MIDEKKNQQMFYVFEAITDKAAEEHFEYNTASKDNVDSYATNGCEIVLEPDRLDFLYEKLQEIKNNPQESQNDYYYRFEEPILNYDANRKA